MNQKTKIKLGYCIAYDWELLKTALPLTYPFVDSICLALDGDRITWANNAYDFNEKGFQSFIESIDTENKINIYEDNFHLDKISSMNNEVSQRNKMADYMGRDSGWHLQFDVDEYPVDMEGFTRFLRRVYSSFEAKANICVPFITLFKETSKGYLAIDSKVEWMPVATKMPLYHHGRRNGYFNYHTDFPLLHQSWARDESEIEQKISNWGHKDDFDVIKYYNFWQGINSKNYERISDFHPIQSDIWKNLVLLKGKSIQEMLNDKSSLSTLRSYNRWDLFIHNNRNIARLKSLLFKMKI